MQYYITTSRTKPSKTECHRRPTYLYRSTKKGSLKTLVRSGVCGDQQKCLNDRPQGTASAAAWSRLAGGRGNWGSDGTDEKKTSRLRWGRWSAGSGEGGDRPVAAGASAGRQRRGRPPAHGGRRPSHPVVPAPNTTQWRQWWRMEGDIQPVAAGVAASQPWRGGGGRPAAAAEAASRRRRRRRMRLGGSGYPGGGEGKKKPSIALHALLADRLPLADVHRGLSETRFSRFLEAQVAIKQAVHALRTHHAHTTHHLVCKEARIA